MEETINDRINKLIIALKLSPNAFAGRLGIKTTIVYNIQKGRNKPSFDILAKICAVFGVSGDWLVTGKGSFDVENIRKYNINDNINDNSNDNISGNNVGDTVQNGEYDENADDTIKIQLRRKEIEEVALKQLSLTRQKREWDEELSARPSPLFAGDPTFAKSQKLQDLKLSYNKRIRMDLKATNEKLYEILTLVEDNETIIDIVQDVNLNYIANQPDPFESTQYYDLDNSTFNIPDTIDYRDYKGNIVVWLEEVKKYKESVLKFYAAADTFLKEVTGKDNYGF